LKQNLADINPGKELAVLLGIIRKQQRAEEVYEYLDELAFLTETAGGVAVKKFTQKLEYPDPRTYIGSGKLNEIKDFVKENKISLVIADDELSGSQIRNIEQILECRVLDRSSLILDIFAKRARSAQAKTQVELAQYKYLLPRLTRMWTHLEKQRGGIGMRGPGETEIETDRRVIKDKLARLKEKLITIEKQSITQRKQRGEMVRLALVGYTNAGKSTVMNLLSKSDVFAENKLFATVDTTVRKVQLDHVPCLISDTVGFIRKLPHDLIESFKSTLDEVIEADILLHVVDISHPQFKDHINVVNTTLGEIGAGNKATVMIFNKIDAYRFVKKEEDDLSPLEKENISLEDFTKMWMAKEHNTSIFISALEKKNTDLLRHLLSEMAANIYSKRYPHQVP
jgi:GTP-binding protein HflX